MPRVADDPCCESQPALLSVDVAVATLLDHARPLMDSERVTLGAAAGRILARDLMSPIDVPGFDNSAMDGYALHSRDLALARSAGLVISQRIPAGVQGKPLQPGSAARIFTGAPVPEGADTVLMQEVCRIEGERVYAEKTAEAGANIRPRGNDITAGNTLLPAGTLLQAAELGLAASVGIADIEVRRRLRVAVFSTGDELVEPGQRLAPGHIYNSNRYLLNALLEAQGCDVVDLGSIADSLEATRATLSTASRNGRPGDHLGRGLCRRGGSRQGRAGIARRIDPVAGADETGQAARLRTHRRRPVHRSAGQPSLGLCDLPVVRTPLSAAPAGTRGDDAEILARHLRF